VVGFNSAPSFEEFEEETVQNYERSVIEVAACTDVDEKDELRVDFEF